MTTGHYDFQDVLPLTKLNGILDIDPEKEKPSKENRQRIINREIVVCICIVIIIIIIINTS